MTTFKAIEWLESVVRPLEIPKQPSNFLIGQSFMFPTTNGCSIVKTSGMYLKHKLYIVIHGVKQCD